MEPQGQRCRETASAMGAWAAMGFLEKAARTEAETEKRQKFVKDLQKCVLCRTTSDMYPVDKEDWTQEIEKGCNGLHQLVQPIAPSLLLSVFNPPYLQGSLLLIGSVGPKPDTTLIFSLIPNLISGNQDQGRISKIRLFPDIRVMSDIRILTWYQDLNLISWI